MTPEKLTEKLHQLLRLPSELEWFEFKEANNDFNSGKLGQYFSALSNEANLKGQDCGWLILGVQDKPKKIIGTNFRPDRAALDSLKHEVAEHTNGRITFREIYELKLPEGRVILFQIPPAPMGIPTSWKGHFYGRDGESLGPLGIDELEHIRRQVSEKDWSAEICSEAALADLDSRSIKFAREQYKKKNPSKVQDVDQWDDLTFLNKARVLINGKITNTALLLLGKEESTHFLSPAMGQITWVLRDHKNIEKDYQHFYLPLILAVDVVFAKIRNLIYRYIPNAGLFPVEVTEYEPWVIRELLHNCIAHQDYAQNARISVVENPDFLLFTNAGSFIPGSVENVIIQDAPPRQYRNRFLAQAMVNLNMIDTIGSGIKRIFEKQRSRFFPMPDYDLSDPNAVKVKLLGKILDEKYTRMLVEKTDFDLLDVIALDRVQKRQKISDMEYKRLKQQKLVEGRRPNLFVSANVALITGDKATYIKNRAFNKPFYKKIIVEYLTKFGIAKRSDFDDILLNKLSEQLKREQKRHVITNLIQEMRLEGIIYPIGSSRRWAEWRLSKEPEKSSAQR